MLLSAVSVLVAAQTNSEVPKGLINYPVYEMTLRDITDGIQRVPCKES